MIRDDNSVFLLYMEPPLWEKLKEPIEDELTELLRKALKAAKKGTANYSRENEEPIFDEGDRHRWMGTHETSCGKRSTDKDYLLENGMITNSLAPFYVANYRSSICMNDWMKIQALIDFYQVKIDISSYLNKGQASEKNII